MQQGISWADVDLVLFRNMALLGHNGWNNCIKSLNVFNFIHTITIRTDPKGFNVLTDCLSEWYGF